MRLLWPFVVVTLVVIGTQGGPLQQSGDKEQELVGWDNGPEEPGHQEDLPGHQEEAEKFKCEISGDPHLVTFGNQKVSFPWPCVILVATLVKYWTGLSDGYNATHTVFVDIYAASDIETYKDRYFVSYVDVDMQHFINYSNLKTTTLTLDASQSHFKQPNATSIKWREYRSADDDVIQNQVHYGYDSTNNLYYVSVMGSLRVTFRPLNRSQGIPQASGRPGLVIEFTKDQFIIIADFPKSVCSAPSDNPSFQELAEEEGFTSSQDLMVYTSLKNGLPEKQFEQTCIDVLAAFEMCKDQPEEIFKNTINIFAELFASPSEKKRCLEKNQNILDVFSLSIRANLCFNDTATEEMYKLFVECQMP